MLLPIIDHVRLVLYTMAEPEAEENSSMNRLSTDDLREIRRLLYPARRKWRDIGIELGLKVEDLDTIRHQYQDIGECFTAMLTCWLKSTDPVPTWRALAEALMAEPVNEVELAQKGRGGALIRSVLQTKTSP